MPDAPAAHWFLLQTHSNAERLARDALTAPYRGCTVYLPLMLITVLHARRKKEVERAFLPRYLFVLNEGQGVPVMRSCPGVTHLAKRGDQLILVPPWVIDQIKHRETNGYVDLDACLGPAPLVQYRKGETVRVTDGPFASFNGIFERWRGDERRAAILVNIFGRHTPVELEPRQFEKL